MKKSEKNTDFSVLLVGARLQRAFTNGARFFQLTVWIRRTFKQIHGEFRLQRSYSHIFPVFRFIRPINGTIAPEGGVMVLPQIIPIIILPDEGSQIGETLDHRIVDDTPVAAIPFPVQEGRHNAKRGR